MLLLLLVACDGAASSGSAPGSATLSATPAAPPVPVRAEVVAPVPLDRAYVTVGVVATPDSVEIRSEGPGLVASVAFEDGHRVRRGALLVQLRDAEAQAGLLDARARAKLARLALERARAVAATGDISLAEIDAAEAQEQLAEAAVLRAEEGLRKTRIVAPFDGVLGLRTVSVGQAVDPSRTLTRIEALGHLLVDVSLPEEAAARIALAQTAEIHVDAIGGPPLPGRVSFVAPRVDGVSRTLPVRITIDAPDPRLRPGMTAHVRIVTERVEGALMVPSQALVPSANGPSVWLIGSDGIVVLTHVITGERTTDRLEIVSGLAAGDSLVIEGLARLRPGATVTVLPPASLPAPPSGLPPEAARP